MNAQAAEKTPEKKPEAAKPTTEQKKEKPVTMTLEQLDKEDLESLNRLEANKVKRAEIKKAQASGIYAQITKQLNDFADVFTPGQKKSLATLLGFGGAEGEAPAPKTAKAAGAPKGNGNPHKMYKLPSGDEAGQRGVPSKKFIEAATKWAATPEGKAWIADKKNPKYPLNPEWKKWEDDLEALSK